MAKLLLTVQLKKDDGTNIVVLNSAIKNTRTEAEADLAAQIQTRVDNAGANLSQEQAAQTAFNS